ADDDDLVLVVVHPADHALGGALLGPRLDAAGVAGGCAGVVVRPDGVGEPSNLLPSFCTK
ncbi:MAG TPA: hypothetical protein VHK64_08275, partial [Nocardioidaceae bacterium]|nr:hypothetical protein [Nocardioidaceae bacterium]